MSAPAWESVIGLEVHVQLATRTKLFCACANTFGEDPNTHVCPVCTGQPGALPAPNAEAVRLATRLALALGAHLPERSRFARKHYFYCDLPKGYQTSQYDRPFSSGGAVTLPSGTRLPLVRAHLEEDAGKAVHDRGEGTLVDLNRAGVPLVEIVSEPALRSAEDATAYLGALRALVRWLEVSDGDMEKGSLRCDVNVSVRPPGEAGLRTKVELKNLNSIRHVSDAIAHEVARQVAAYGAGEEVVQETRLWDPDRGESRVMRRKEDEADYRYLDDPDLPPLALPAAVREEERARLPELPEACRRRYVQALGLSEYDAGVLTGSRPLARFFEEVLAECDDAKLAANWVTNGVLAVLGPEEGPEDLGFGPRALGRLVRLVHEGTLSNAGARRVFGVMRERGGEPEALVEELGLAQVDDPAEIEGWCREALKGREGVVAAVRAGNDKALGALFGPVMKASGGRANPALVRSVLLRLVLESS